jgi:TPR repeat protein
LVNFLPIRNDADDGLMPVSDSLAASCSIVMPAEPKRPQNFPSAPSGPAASRAKAAAVSLRQARMGSEEISRLQAAAQASDPAAQRELGLACFRGLGVRRDLARAFKWLTLAAEGGDAAAMAHLEVLLPGLSGEDIAEGRRLIARAKGQPEPEFGFSETDFSALELADLDLRGTQAEGLGGAFSPWRPAEADPKEDAQPLPAVPRASAGFQSSNTYERKSSSPTVSPLQPPTVEVPVASLPGSRGTSRALVWGIWLMAGTTCALVAALLIFLGQSDSVATLTATPPTLAEFLPNPSSAAVAANPVPPAESRADGQKPSAVVPALELTALSRTLPLSLQQIKVSAQTLARWQRLEELQCLAEEGDNEAQFDLAQWYLLQAQTTNDFVEAFNNLKLAAEAGHVPAQNNVGVCYVTGTGVKQDYVEGYKWFALATSGGLKSATGNRNRAAEFLTADQLASASARIADYLHEGSKAPPPAVRVLNQPFSKIVPPRGYP